MPGFVINIDAHEVRDRLDIMIACMKPERYERAMYRIYSRTGKHVRAILKKDLPAHYQISAGKVEKATGNAQIQGMGCIIPIRDRRGSIGGQYRASGGAHGWNAVRRKRYKVKTRILKAGQSVLPDAMPGPGYTGNPPFRNLGSKLGKLTFTRKGKARFPILKVSGIAIPQMPMNLSQHDVQRDVKDWLAKQVEREFMNMLAGR